MRVLAVILGCVSASILLAEATLLPSDVDLSLFSNLINAGKQEVLVQVRNLPLSCCSFPCYHWLLVWSKIYTWNSLSPTHVSINITFA
jgi:hypothetical protein